MKHVNAAQVPAHLWKNGRGRTRELDIYPESAELDNFIWRVSVADIDEDADFSEFNNIDRIITLIQGESAILQFDNGHHHTLEPCRPFRFKGEQKVRATLSQGSVKDLNLMMDRRRASGCVLFQCEAAEISCDPESLYWLFCPNGRWHIKTQNAQSTDVWELGLHDYLRFDPSLTRLSFKPEVTGSTLLIAQVQHGASAL
jgi:hypothetical protein